MARSLQALAELADEVKAGAETAMASIDDMLVFVDASNKRIQAMEASHQSIVAAMRDQATQSMENAHGQDR